MFRIGEFSQMSKTTVKTLRYYDEIGLLKPEQIDPLTGHRFYTTEQLVKLHRIQGWRQAGMSIDEIRSILEGHNVIAILEKRKRELTAQLGETELQLSRIEFILQGRKEEDFMSYVAAIKTIPECIVYSKRMTIPDYQAYFEVIPAIGQQMIEKYPDLKCAKPEYCFIIYLDGEYKERDIHVEYCEAVTELRPDFDDIHFKKMEPVTVASVMHKGPYAGLAQAYAYVFKWIEENGYIVADAPRESYIDGIWNKENEEDWLTELQVPIKK